MARKELIFTRAGLREVDRRAVEEFGIPIVVLMENAGRAVALAAIDMLGGKSRGIAIPRLEGPGMVMGRKTLILAGPGNNGGDGLVAARFLHNWGVEVTVLLLAGRESYKDAADVQLKIVEAMKLPLEVMTAGHAEFRDWLVEAGPEDLVIDAIFGTGLSRKVEGLAAEVIAAANKSRHRILAVDIPSGMDADTGEAPPPEGVAIKATETVSFCGLKKGFQTPSGRELVGRVTVAEIGAPRELLEGLSEAHGR